MADQEQKYRQRYVDLITDESARVRFTARSKAVSALREFMVANDFLEVETPMLHPIPAARTPSPSRRTTTRSTRRCSCASRPSCT
jgi:lysyl-tRNA synthetase class 2